jgi:hypothetical protein
MNNPFELDEQMTRPKKSYRERQMQSQASDGLAVGVGMAGAVALFLGPFCPVFRMPVMGSINYIVNGKGDGVFVAVIAVIAGGLVLPRLFGLAWFASCVGLAVCARTFARLFLTPVEPPKPGMIRMNPADMIQIEWGWALMAIGFLAIAGAWVVSGTSRDSGPGVPIAGVLFGIIAGVGAGVAIASL